MTEDFIYIIENFNQLIELSSVSLTELDENNFQDQNNYFVEKEVPLDPEPKSNNLIQKGFDMAKKAIGSIWD